MRLPQIVRFGPRRTWARPGDVVAVDAEVRLAPGQGAALTVTLLDLDRELTSVRRSVLAAPRSPRAVPLRHTVELMLPPAPRHGYGLSLRVQAGGRTLVSSSAIEAIDGWWQSPRHAAITEFRDSEASARAVRDLAAWHVTVVQHYDWMWRHYRYEPPGGVERFRDALGREVSHSAVRSAIAAGHEVGLASLAYGSVYGAEPEYVQRHPEERVFDDHGEPLSLGGTFFITDLRPGSPWRRRLLREYRAAIRGFRFDGIHMDTYGRPHRALSADGERLELADLYPGLIDEASRSLSEVRADARVLFNCVEGFPLGSVAASPTASLYLELWPRDRSFADVVRWIERALAVAEGRQVVVAAYAAALRDVTPGDPRRDGAFEATLLLGSIIIAAGAYHHTIAEGGRLLVEGYYPAAVPMRAAERRGLRALWTFSARYLHLLSDRGRVPADLAGLLIRDHEGHIVRTAERPVAGAIWVTASQLTDGRRVLHVVDLRGQTDDAWDEPKVPARTVSGFELEWPGLRDPIASSPWSRRGDCLRLRSPSAAGATWRLPTFRRWLLITEAGAEGPSRRCRAGRVSPAPGTVMGGGLRRTAR